MQVSSSVSPAASSDASIAVVTAAAVSPPSPVKKLTAPFWVTFVAGGYYFFPPSDEGQDLPPYLRLSLSHVCSISGTVGAVLTNPLEVVKTRMQVSSHGVAPLANESISFTNSPNLSSNRPSPPCTSHH